jgi:hypothetical protein
MAAELESTGEDHVRGENNPMIGMVTLKALMEGVSFAIPAEVIRDLFEKRKE